MPMTRARPGLAFSITNDHLRQEQVWDTISRSHNQDAYYSRRMLTKPRSGRPIDASSMSASTPYEAAGRVVMCDLFEQDNGEWLQDPGKGRLQSAGGGREGPGRVEAGQWREGCPA